LAGEVKVISREKNGILLLLEENSLHSAAGGTDQTFSRQKAKKRPVHLLLAKGRR